MTGELIIDSFAGGGGASTGIEMALGRSPDYAINHDANALAMHAVNHPDTIHLDSNIWDVAPLSVTQGRPVGLLWASPDCKHFSKAKGGKPLDRNIRDLAWVVVRWAEEVKPRVIILENVEEFRTWGPVYEDGTVIKELQGQTFEDWQKRLRRAGYKLQVREIRAFRKGAPTIRNRLFVVMRRDGMPIVWPADTHGAPHEDGVKRGKLKPWKTAADHVIDWSLPCPSIFDTAPAIKAQYGLKSIRPLAPNTMARIARGMKRYVLDADRPFLVNLTHGSRCEPLDQPINTITGANRGEKAVIVPHVSAFYGPGDGGADRSAHPGEPLRVVTTENRHAVIAPNLMSMKGKSRRDSAADAPHPSILAGGGHASLVAPVLSHAQQGGRNRPIDEPSHTITASSKDQNQLLAAFLAQNNYQEPGHDAREPVSTIVTKGSTQSVVSAFVAQHNGDPRGDGADGARPGRSVAEPLSTVTQRGTQQNLVSAFVTRQFGKGTGHAADVPTATVTADANKTGLVAPFLHAYYGSDQDTPENEPLHTLTTKPRFGHVETAICAPPFEPHMEQRARQVADFMRAHGFWDDREFVTLVIAGETYIVADIGMRMLTPRELFNAQGFPPDYEIDRGIDGRVFTKTVQVSCVGNSVCPPVAAALVAANCNDMAAWREAAE